MGVKVKGIGNLYRSNRCWAAAVALLAGLLVVGPVRAGASQEAAVLKARGDQAFDARRFTEALESYQAALKKRRDARLHYNIAQALTAIGRYPEALQSYQAFLTEAPAGMLNEAQQATLFKLLEDLKGRISRLELTCDVPGARVLVRGRTVGATPLQDSLVLNAGAARVEVLAEGYEPFEATMELPGGTSVPLLVRLKRVDFTGWLTVTSNVAGADVMVDGVRRGVTPLRLKIAQGTHVVVVKAEDHEDRGVVASVVPGEESVVEARLERAPDYTLAYFGFGVAGVGVAAGTITGIVAYARFENAKEDCDQVAKECGPAGRDDLAEAKSWALLSTVGFGVGVAGLAVGTYGLMTSDASGQESRVGVALGPGQVTLRGSF